MPRGPETSEALEAALEPSKAAPRGLLEETVRGSAAQPRAKARYKPEYHDKPGGGPPGKPP